jgi:hypothetical protein
MTIADLNLPATDGHVDVTILDGGGLIGTTRVMHEGDAEKDVRMCCWVFYIHHRKSNKKIFWDVGVSAVSSLFSLS